jgi:uncharacterized DUF497 family protein
MDDGPAMTFDFIEWDELDDMRSNTAHIAEHGVTQDEVQEVLTTVPDSKVFRSRSSGRPAVIGDTAAGRTLFVAFERRKEGGDILITPVTAYDHQ